MKRTRVYSRRRIALRRLVKAAAVLLVAQQFFLIGLLTPRQAIWKMEERQGVKWTRVVARDWSPEVHWSHLMYLTGNEEATVLSDTYLTLYGWMGGFGNALDCTTGAAFYAGERTVRREGKENSTWYYYGRVDDPAIETVVISMQYEVWEDDGPVRREVRRETVGREDMIRRGGRQYFLLVLPELEWTVDAPVKSVAAALDSQGRELARMDITEKEHSYYG